MTGEVERAQQRLQERKNAMYAQPVRPRMEDDEAAYRALLVGTDLDARELRDQTLAIAPAYGAVILSSRHPGTALAAVLSDGIIVGLLIAEERHRLNGDRVAPALERAVKGAIDDLETEARMHWLRGDKLGEESQGPGAVQGEHRIAEQLRARADELQKALNQKETK